MADMASKRERKACSVYFDPDDWAAIQAYRETLEAKELMPLSAQGVIGRLVKIGLKEANRRASK